MSTNLYGLVIEGLVAVLLVLTIGYCMILNRRLSRLRSDEGSFRVTIAELISATESAERAIAGLKMTLRECEETLAARLDASETANTRLENVIERGEGVLARIARIAQVADGARGKAAEPPQAETVQPLHAGTPVRKRATDTMTAAQALAQRARLRAGAAA